MSARSNRFDAADSWSAHGSRRPIACGPSARWVATSPWPIRSRSAGSRSRIKSDSGRVFVRGILKGVDAIELYNGGIPRQANAKAEQYAATSTKRLTVGSDSHRLGTIGSCGVYLDTSDGETSDALFQSLTTADDQRFEVCDTAFHLPTLGLMALKHTRHFVISSGRRRRA